MPYKTTDFYLASFLKAAGYDYKGLEFDPHSRKATFLFTGVRQADVLAYYNRTEARIAVLDYVSAVRQTRELLYNLPEE